MILEKMEQIEQFTDAERQIIHYLLTHSEDVLSLSVRDLAKHTFTSASTVNRLANKLTGGEGFIRFKAGFFREMHRSAASCLEESPNPDAPSGSGHPSNSEMLPHPEGTNDITMDETVYSIAGKVAAAEIDAIERTLRSIDYPSFYKAAMLLHKADAICFFGFDDNLSIVKPYLYRMMSFGKQIVLHDASNAQYYQALTLPRGSAALLLSRTGENRRLSDIASILRDKKIPILLLTPSRESTLGKLADEWIEIQNGLLPEARGSILFDTSVHYILNVLCSLMFSGNYENSRAILAQYGRIYQGTTGENISGVPSSAVSYDTKAEQTKQAGADTKLPARPAIPPENPPT